MRPQGKTAQLREVLKALRAMRDGDFSARLPSDWSGLTGKIADIFNEIVFSNQRVAEDSTASVTSSARKARRVSAPHGAYAAARGA